MRTVGLVIKEKKVEEPKKEKEIKKEKKDK